MRATPERRMEGLAEHRGMHNAQLGATYPLVLVVMSGAVVFDLGLNRSEHLPDAAMGYQACVEAAPGGAAQGCVGAGTGATVGKLFGLSRAMKSGQGFAFRETRHGLHLWALAVVNAFGDVLDYDTGAVIAGARTAADSRGSSPGVGKRQLNRVTGVRATRKSYSTRLPLK